MKITRPYDNAPDIVVVEDICSKEDLGVLKRHVKEYFKKLHQISIDKYNTTMDPPANVEEVDAILSKVEALAQSVMKQEFPQIGKRPRFTPTPFKNFILRVEGESMTPHYDGVPGLAPEKQPPNVGSIFYITDENDDLVGGETFYPYLGIAYRPVGGSIIIHPGTPEYLHGVLEVKSGHRVTINLFAILDNEYSLATLDENDETPRVGKKTGKGYI
jgi:hypothetical protein